ncbi:MAG: VIT1/CCC1 transporter family protein, partial [Patescibacteria group bacterium]
GIGSYLSNKSEEEVNKRKIDEEKKELEKFPGEEKNELFKMYTADGWPEELASKMAKVAAQNKEIMLKEMTMRELQIPSALESISIRGGIYMFLAYVMGGMIPLFAYLVLPIKNATPISIAITLAGLFILGMSTTKFTKQPLLKSGLRILIMGGIALAAGLAAGLLLGQ